jgi:hypothetical protein
MVPSHNDWRKYKEEPEMFQFGSKCHRSSKAKGAATKMMIAAEAVITSATESVIRRTARRVPPDGFILGRFQGSLCSSFHHFSIVAMLCV